MRARRQLTGTKRDQPTNSRRAATIARRIFDETRVVARNDDDDDDDDDDERERDDDECDDECDAKCDAEYDDTVGGRIELVTLSANSACCRERARGQLLNKQTDSSFRLDAVLVEHDFRHAVQVDAFVQNLIQFLRISRRPMLSHFFRLLPLLPHMNALVQNGFVEATRIDALALGARTHVGARRPAVRLRQGSDRTSRTRVGISFALTGA